MDIDAEIKKLKERGPDKPIPTVKMAKLMATMLDKASVSWVGNFFWDKTFQKLAEFEKLEQGEKDRIFNELIIAPLTLLCSVPDSYRRRKNHFFKSFLHVSLPPMARFAK